MESFVMSFLSMLVALGIVLALAWFSLRFLRTRMQGAAPSPAEGPGEALKFVRAIAVGTKERVVIVEHRGKGGPCRPERQPRDRIEIRVDLRALDLVKQLQDVLLGPRMTEVVRLLALMGLSAGLLDEATKLARMGDLLRQEQLAVLAPGRGQQRNPGRICGDPHVFEVEQMIEQRRVEAVGNRPACGRRSRLAARAVRPSARCQQQRRRAGEASAGSLQQPPP